MPITVELQDMYQYSVLIIILLVLLLVGSAVLIPVIWIIRKKAKKKEAPKPVAPVKKEVPLTKAQIKQKYCVKLDELEQRCKSGKTDSRRGYQELSVLMRSCAYELTGRPVHKYTLDEISKGNIPGLAELIDDCYAPEFSQDKQGDIFGTINKARMVMEQWT